MKQLGRCWHCGKRFVPHHCNAKMCSEQCRQEAKQESLERAYAKARAARAERAWQQNCKKEEQKEKILTMAEINARARELHMSYGNYVLKYLQ